MEDCGEMVLLAVGIHGGITWRIVGIYLDSTLWVIVVYAICVRYIVDGGIVGCCVGSDTRYDTSQWVEMS